MDQELTNSEIAVYALYKLGGAEHKIHTEKVAELCYRLAGAQFSWRLKEFSLFPDKDIARIALYDAAKEKYGHLLRRAINRLHVIPLRTAHGVPESSV